MASQSKTKQGSFKDVTKDREMRNSNIVAAKAVADAIRTSLGPKGMDKMIEQSSGEILISNDGATILNEMHVLHPAAQMLVQLAKAQDIEAGDGTSTVVVIAGQLLEAAGKLYEKAYIQH
ncbi:T-complex protein 1 subunit delta [Trichinella spiralis]|uniref:T-complex protein 1 subunit delta n=1 Tax=Trichinella spiralis TaxID=6334 RepID=A0ABR3KRL2_TRISP